MARFVRKEKQDIGLPPDELVFRGRRKMEHTRKRVIIYGPDTVEEYEPERIEDITGLLSPGKTVWVNIDGIHDELEMGALGTLFNLDPRMLSHVMNVQQRATVLEFDDSLYISLKMVHYTDEAEGRVSAEQLSLVVKDSLVISFQEHTGDVFDPIRDRIRRRRKIVSSGADFLAFALIDVVIDTYALILSQLGDRIEELEGELIEGENGQVLDQIYLLKRELNYLRKNTLPAREMVIQLAKIDSDLVNEHNEPLIRELVDNSSLVNESAESYREILSDQLAMHHTRLGTKLNDIMKVLTIFSALFIPLTFIAGIYGTNFDYIPELSFRYAYFIMLGVMAVMATGMLIFFRRRRWFR
jgi:magnesium transporter